MNPTQVLITVGYGFAVLLSCVAAFFVIRSTGTLQRRSVDHAGLARNEVRWGLIVGLMLVVLLGLSIFDLPYGKTEAKGRHQVVQVTGQQFGWAISPPRIRAGEPVEFHLRSRDVQHGFGVFKGTELLFQVQVPAVDGGTQRYVYTFADPGVYDVLCMEFCGVEHHTMRGSITVVR